MASPVTPFTEFRPSFKPLTHTTPFTHTGYAFLEMYEELVQYLTHTLSEEINTNLDLIYEQTQTAVNGLAADIATTKAQWQALFDQFMLDIIEELEGLNDQAVANLVNNSSSLIRVALDTHFASMATQTTVEDGRLKETELEKRYARLGYNVANVLDFGAKGDGVTDDTVAIEAARDFVLGKRGATVLYPPAVYVQANVSILSGVTYSGYGATIKPLSYNAFRGKSDARRGYGGGGGNVVIEGLTFMGDFTGLDKAAAVTLHHAKNVTFKDCVFDEAVLGGHAIDLSGCEGINIDHCSFIGFNPPSGREYAEAIQIDHSTASGVSNQDLPQSYDGLPCIDISITNNRFLPKTVGGIDYYAPNPVGSHATLKDNHQRIAFTGNTVIKPFPSRDLNAIVAPIHFQGVEDLRVSDNYFGGHDQPTSVIKLISYSTGIGPGDISNPSPGPGVNVGVRASRNIFIENNVFEGFNSDENKGLVVIRGADLGALSPENISVSGNVFKDCLASGVRGNVGSNPVAFLYCKNIRVDENIVNRARSLVYANAVDGLAVRNNVINDTEWVAVHVEGTANERCKSILVSGNLIDRVGSAVYVSKSDSVVVNSNAVTRTKDGQSLAGYANGNITVSECDTASVAGNSVHGLTPPNTSGAIQFLNTVLRGAGVGNTSYGWANTVYADPSSLASVKNVGNVSI